MTNESQRFWVILSIPVIPQKVNIYRRKDGGNFHARIKLATGEWHRVSLQVSELEAAKEKALAKYFEYQILKDQNLPQVAKTCSGVARIAINQMQSAIERGRGKKVYKDYIEALRKYFLPFFGNRHINTVTPDLIEEFKEYRLDILGREPAVSTLNTHHSAFNRVFQIALDNGWILKSQVPEFRAKGLKRRARPTFTMTEFRSLAKFILKWKKTGKYLQTRKKRELLSDYVFILSNTGIRHGTEMLNLKWKHIEWFIGENSKRYLQITVSGKTGNRQLIARHSTIVYLKNIQSRFENLNDISFDELLNRKIDQYVIRLRDGTRPKSLDKSFRQLLTDSGLLYGTTSDMPRTLYSLRHFYATYQLMKGRNIHSLARQMGTSVGMIEQHYSKLTPMLMAEEFAGDD